MKIMKIKLNRAEVKDYLKQIHIWGI